jgi:hypothetical protein
MMIYITYFRMLVLSISLVSGPVSVHAVRKSSASSLSISRRPNTSSTIRDNISIILRGGQSQDPYAEQPTYYSNGSSTPQEGYQNPEDGFANYNPPPSGADTNIIDREDDSPFKESVQERTDKWRTAQMEKYGNLTPQQEYNPRDEDGRMKLMSSVSKGSRALIFFILMWRDVYLFDVADQFIKGSFRKGLVRCILTSVFIGNLAGVVISVTSPAGHSTKNRLKAILNLDKVVETGLLLWNFGRVTLFPSKYVPREIFIAGIMHSIFFVIQCQAFTRVTWDEKVAPLQQQQHNQKYQQQTSGEYQQQQQPPQQQQTLGDVESSNVDYGMKNPGINSATEDPYYN